MLNPFWYIPRMTIRGKDGRLTTLRNLRQEQWEILEALVFWRNVLILKPRQIGASTIVCAYLFWRSLFAEEAFNWLILTHEAKAVMRMNQMLRTYLHGTPKAWRPSGLDPDNMSHIGFPHNQSEFLGLMAGGRSQGRGFSFQGVWATEMGLWPRGSSAVQGEGVDEAVWSSVQSTLGDGEHTRKIVESTANGPGGVFHKQTQTARESSEWRFLFFAWSSFAEYAIDPPKDWERTQEEHELAVLHGLDDRQLAWRRRKIVDEGYGLERFRREYPLTWEEPFLLAGGYFFDLERLNSMLASMPAAQLNQEAELTVYERFDPKRRYYIGGDVGAGVGGDESVWQVVRDDFAQVAVYASRHRQPKEFAEIGARLSIQYGKCPIMTESNSYGRAVIDRLDSLNANTWKDHRGNDWWTNPVTKAQVYDFLRFLVADDHTRIEDPATIHQMMRIREQRSGRLEADEGEFDDRADALALACWLGRQRYSPAGRPMTATERAQARRAAAQRQSSLWR